MADQTWERREDESERAYEAFLTYRDMGAGRTVRDAYRQRQRKPNAIQADGTWNRWVKEYEWAARARDFDNHLQAERDDVALAAARRREARRLELREMEWRLAVGMTARAEEMMRYPLVTRTLDEGKTVFKPARWSAKDVAAYSAIASKLGRSALDMDGPTPPEPPAPVTEEQVRAAEKTLDEWRQQQNQAMMTSENSPPPPTPDTSPTPSG